jgi:hypothetical protein
LISASNGHQRTRGTDYARSGQEKDSLAVGVEYISIGQHRYTQIKKAGYPLSSALGKRE